jgi:hypothetical protein
VGWCRQPLRGAVVTLPSLPGSSGYQPVPPLPGVHLPDPGAGLPYLPGYTPGQPSVQDINSVSAKATQTVAAVNSVIPIVYGRDRSVW